MNDYKELIEFYEDAESYELRQVAKAIKQLVKERDVATKKLNNFINEIEFTNWYHICNRVLVEGSPNEEEGFYKAKDILKICNKYRSDVE